MDTKILRAATVSTFTFLVFGFFIGTFGSWGPIINLSNNFLGAIAVSFVFSVFLIIIYNKWFANFLPGGNLVKGALFGGLVWVVFLILGGLFSTFRAAVYPPANPIESLILSLILLTSWGSVTSLSLDSKS